ncbi:MAG: hypothetical protein GC151_13775 [Betaproteobacteria bacterium]|nr:hypothetical protein [Betaproteobacteria bacterium]
MTEYSNGPQERGYRVLQALAGHEVFGLAPSDLAKGLNEPASSMTRDLGVLCKVGLAERIEETGRYRLGPRIVQIALAHMRGIDKVRTRLNETEQRYSRDPR